MISSEPIPLISPHVNIKVFIISPAEIMNTFIFTCGDINGIGSELIIKTLNRIHTLPDKRFIVLIPYNVFELTAGIVKPEFNFTVTNNQKDLDKKDIMIYDLGKAKQVLGSVSKEAGKF